MTPSRAPMPRPPPRSPLVRPRPGAVGALQRAVGHLLRLLAGAPILLPGIDLVAVANLSYDGVDPEVDPSHLTVASYALDMYWYRAGEERRVGGMRALGLHYDLCRYVLPFLLEHRGQTGPLTAGAWRITDLTRFVQILAGEHPLPAATVAADRLGRLALTCHWLDLEDAARVCDLDRAGITAAITAGLPVSLAEDGQPVVRAMDLRRAGLLVEKDEPHGLAQATADKTVQLLRMTWRRTASHGAMMVGDPTGITGKHPLPANRQHDPKPTARVYVPIQRCLQVAAALHPVHQRVLWEARLLAAREGEIFGRTRALRRLDLPA